MRTAHESQHFQKAPFPSEQAMLSVLQLQLPLDSRSQPSLYSLVCFHRLSQALCCKPSLTRPLFRDKASPNMWETPGHVSLEPVPPWSVSLTLHIPTLYMTSYRPGREQELLLRAFFLITLSFAMVLYQQDALRCHSSNTAIPNQTDRLKASMPFSESSPHTGTHEQFWYRGKYL